MVHYKLHYFDGRGLGETVRQIFKLAGQDFEDCRYNFEQWATVKSTMPFQQMPVLEYDGKFLPQSCAISRFLAKQFGFAGKDAHESALIDGFADQVKDFNNETRPFVAVALGFAEGDLDKLREDVFLPAVKKHFPFFNKAVKDNKSGFLVGDSISWVDLMVAESNHVLFDKNPGIYNDYPELKAHFEKIHAIPQIKAWRESRPVTGY